MINQILLCFLAMTSFISVHAQSVLESWEGTYEGDMVVGFDDRGNDSVYVLFQLLPIEKDSSWSYRMTYVSGEYGQIVKDYIIRRVGNSTVDFLLDEKDGIVIEMSLMNNCFYDMFEVMDQLYATTLRKIDDEIQFDLFTSTKANGTLTKSEADENGDVYEVTSYKPNLHQTVVLKRIVTD